jgi:hypothetical protein
VFEDNFSTPNNFRCNTVIVQAFYDHVLYFRQRQYCKFLTLAFLLKTFFENELLRIKETAINAESQAV